MSNSHPLSTSPIKEVVSIIPCIQQSVSDCVVACVAMLLGIPYPDVSQAAPQLVKRARKKGASEYTLRKLVRTLGSTLHKMPYKAEDNPTGILFLEAGRPTYPPHAVVLFQGILINPSDGLLWDAETYLTLHTYTPEALFVLD